jgi:hypothetical protein
MAEAYVWNGRWDLVKVVFVKLANKASEVGMFEVPWNHHLCKLARLTVSGVLFPCAAVQLTSITIKLSPDWDHVTMCLYDSSSSIAYSFWT